MITLKALPQRGRRSSKSDYRRRSPVNHLMIHRSPELAAAGIEDDLPCRVESGNRTALVWSTSSLLHDLAVSSTVSGK